MSVHHNSPAYRWDPPLWLTGSTAHAYQDCQDMRPNAEVCTTSVDPDFRRQSGVVACRYCVDRWKAEP